MLQVGSGLWMPRGDFGWRIFVFQVGYEGSGVLQQEFQVGFAPGDVSPILECPNQCEPGTGNAGEARTEPGFTERCWKTLWKTAVLLAAISHTSDGSCCSLF